MKPDNKYNSRRNFLVKGIGAAALVTSAGAIANSLFKNEDVLASGETVKLLSPDGKIVEIDKSYIKPAPEIMITDKQAREGIKGKKFVMVIDLSQCKNLRKCHNACEKMHSLTPQKEWLKVLKIQDSENSAPYWQPTPCFHCDNPPCVKVCPVDATFKREDGIVAIDNNRCIGCRFCMVACPYSARTFDWGEVAKEVNSLDNGNSIETSKPAQCGTVSKCDFCPDMIRQGKLPACVTACPNGAFYFGDENEDAVSNGDETVRLSELLKDKSGYRYLEDLGTKPRVYYLPPVNRMFPFEDDEFSKDNYKNFDHEQES